MENGMLGLIKENSPLYWFNKFNLFIEELDNLGKDNWSKQEQLVNLVNNSDYCIYESKVIRLGLTPNMKLRHLWIQI